MVPVVEVIEWLERKKQMNQDEDMEINLPATSSEDHIGDVETLQQTLDRSEGESIWNTDVEFNPELADETLSEGAPLTSVIADTVIEQGDVSMSKGTTFSVETGGDYAGLDEALDDKVVDRLIQSRDHLLVPINVQAFVVPPTKPKPQFPHHWGKPPALQTRDLVKLPENSEWEVQHLQTGFQIISRKMLSVLIKRNLKVENQTPFPSAEMTTRRFTPKWQSWKHPCALTMVRMLKKPIRRIWSLISLVHLIIIPQIQVVAATQLESICFGPCQGRY